MVFNQLPVGKHCGTCFSSLAEDKGLAMGSELSESLGIQEFVNKN